MIGSLEKTPLGVDKITRYKWSVVDTRGELTWINKHELRVDSDHYQRNSNATKVIKLAAEWSWLACGALIVARRNDQYWVIDGQHRLYGALRRSDIADLPCVLFESSGIEGEASGFLLSNTNRKPITAVQKQKALVTCKDEIACFVQDTIDKLGLKIAEAAHNQGQIKCVSSCIRRATEDRSAFVKALSLCATLCKKDGIPIPERVLDGLWYLERKLPKGISDERFASRAIDKGAKLLLQAAIRSQSMYVRGGAKVWAAGILEEMNKGLRIKFALKTD